MIKLLRFLKNSKGSISVEFVLVVPIFLYFMTAIYDMSTYVLTKNKLVRLAATISNDLALQKALTAAQIQATFNSASIIMSPFSASSVGIIVSHITNVGGVSGGAAGTTSVSWRMKTSSGLVSKINSSSCSGTACGTNCGTVCGNATTMPNGLVLTDAQNIIVTEVSYTYVPIIPASFFSTQVMYASMSFVPRSGTLAAPPT